MGPRQHELYTRDGHEKIPDASNYIQTRLGKLLAKAPKGYVPHDYKLKERQQTVRSLRSVSYRILHMIIHSVIYMLKKLYSYQIGQITYEKHQLPVISK